LPGLKPLRPATLFEMAVIAITEQQLSMAAAFHMRARIVRRLGTPVEELRVFPSPQRIAAVCLEELQACGLSRRKAEYMKGLASRIAAGALDLEALWHADDAQVREALLGNRGFGDWSVQYILNRGIGRPDCLPSGDVGLRRVVGDYFAGRRLTAAELEAAMAPFTPYRGLAAYYLAVHWRLRRGPADLSAPAKQLRG
jgi:3-methyladenine DNA glycosylase/8-oxoguanine DNA glycosylase